MYSPFIDFYRWSQKWIRPGSLNSSASFTMENTSQNEILLSFVMQVPEIASQELTLTFRIMKLELELAKDPQAFLSSVMGKCIRSLENSFKEKGIKPIC